MRCMAKCTYCKHTKLTQRNVRWYATHPNTQTHVAWSVTYVTHGMCTTVRCYLLQRLWSIHHSKCKVTEFFQFPLTGKSRPFLTTRVSSVCILKQSQRPSDWSLRRLPNMCQICLSSKCSWSLERFLSHIYLFIYYENRTQSTDKK